ncbi:MAG TPA: leucyl aminopeptidase family protein, partial [Alphaproteobacteria bacterium]|nr:leucyl aminopeptidase family protein [Alphaproteobacteria bacterium]
MNACFADSAASSIPVVPLTKSRLPGWLAGQDASTSAWVGSTGFKAEPGAVALLPGEDGRLGRVLLGVPDDADLWAFAGLPFGLPRGTYRFEGLDGADAATHAALGWALGSYRFDRYRTSERRPAQLVPPDDCDRKAVERAADATFLVRDLVNT